MNVPLKIDGRSCEVEKGFTILQAARAQEIDIPTLCDCPGLPSRGSCRMCVVEIQGKANTPTACTTPVEEGMIVLTNSPKVKALRSELLQMLLADHPSSCLFCPEKSHCDECMVTLRKAGVTTGCRSCPKDGQCELQFMAQEMGLVQADYPGRYRMLKVEKGDPFFDRDYNLCVLCGRCIRTCEALHFSSSINYTKRGAETVIGTPFNRSHLDAGCTFCGACVEVCPTGTLTEKTRKWDGAPEQATSSTCPLCSIGCQISLLSKGNTIIGSLPDHQAGCDDLCVLGRFGITETVNAPARLKQPQRIVGHSRLAVSWEKAISAAADKLSACPPERFEMIVSTNCSNETLYVAQKFCRTVMRSANMHSPALDAYAGNLEIVSGLFQKSQPLSILADAETILCLGFDGKYAQSVVEVELHLAKLKGAMIISINAHPHSPGIFADEWLRPIPGKEPELLELLVERLERRSHPAPVGAGEFSDPRLERAARILEETKSPVFIVGPSFLDHPNRRLLEAIARLLSVSRGRAIALPGEGNPAAALLMGISPVYAQTSTKPDVQYIIGESISASAPDGAFILYQNIYPPSGGREADLVLPAAAFGEENGTMIDSSGRVREMRQAVDPPGEAWPSWRILSRIAQKMGVPGFEYENEQEIQAEIARVIENYSINGQVSRPSLSQGEREAVSEGAQAAQSVAPTYMGFSLTQRVAGLKMLYPGEPHV